MIFHFLDFGSITVGNSLTPTLSRRARGSWLKLIEGLQGRITIRPAVLPSSGDNMYYVNFRLVAGNREFPMRYDVLIAGFGGQGVLLAGNLLSYAALDRGKNVSYFPAYGVEKRGGTATCTVVIADGAVGSPVVGSPSVLVALNQGSLDRFGMKVRPGGICIINSSLADPATLVRDDIQVVSVAMNEIAGDLGDPRMVNMVALGAYVALTGAVGVDSLAGALKEALPERNHRFIPANLKAMECGAQMALRKNAVN